MVYYVQNRRFNEGITKSEAIEIVVNAFMQYYDEQGYLVNSAEAGSTQALEVAAEALWGKQDQNDMSCTKEQFIADYIKLISDGMTPEEFEESIDRAYSISYAEDLAKIEEEEKKKQEEAIKKAEEEEKAAKAKEEQQKQEQQSSNNGGGSSNNGGGSSNNGGGSSNNGGGTSNNGGGTSNGGGSSSNNGGGTSNSGGGSSDNGGGSSNNGGGSSNNGDSTSNGGGSSNVVDDPGFNGSDFNDIDLGDWDGM